MKNDILFSERQRFRKWWFWLLLLGVDGIFVWGFIQQIFYGQPFGSHPFSNAGLILMSALMILASILFLSSHLDTYITKEGIYVRFFPFHLSVKFYSWDSISKLYVRKYSSILEYGGWGIKNANYKRGKVYNVSGNIGLQLEFFNKRKLLIGTQQPEEMQKVLSKMGKLENEKKY